jgi:trigger factor
METLKVTAERLPQCEARLTVEIEPEIVERPLRQVARRLSRRVRIPGFRPGKAPYRIIESRFGRDALLEEVIEQEGQNWYEQALEETELEPYGQAQLEVTSHDPLVMTFTLPVEPAVDLGDYHDIRIEWHPPTVSDEEVEEEMARRGQQAASLEPVDRPAELEDVATLDVRGYIGDQAIVELKERDITLNSEVNYPVTGFADKVVGMEVGQDREFTLTYPQAHPNAAWAGKEARFIVHLHSLKTWVTPELDDELAKTMGDHETLDDWRASVREELEAQALEQAEQEYVDSAVEALVEQAHIEYPAITVERQLDSMLEDVDQSLQQRGLGLDNYLIMTGQSREDYRESQREAAENRVRRGLVLAELVQAEALEVTENDLDDEIARLAEAAGDAGENLRQIFLEEKMRHSLRYSLLNQAALDTLKAIARGEYVPKPSPEPKDEEEAAEEEPAPDAPVAEIAEETSEEGAVEEDEALSEENQDSQA